MVKKVVIIGAGPAGLFAANELAEKCAVTIVDKGKEVETRKCPSPEICAKCNPCHILSGVGGAGLFSDGKINFSIDIGNNLTEIVGHKINQELVNAVERIFVQYGAVISEKTPEHIAKIEHWRKKAAIEGTKFVHARSAHIGTDKLKAMIEQFKKDLEVKGVKFLCDQNVMDISESVIILENGMLEYDELIIAPGRIGAEWLENVVRKLGIEFSYNPIDVGVRVEVPRKITDEITSLSRDMKFYIHTDTYDDEVRTFCACPGGNVTRETHEGFNLVNGHSKSSDESPNTNFAFLVKVIFTEPLGNTNKYGRKIASLAYETGVGKPILQRLGDLRRGRRSRRSKRHEFQVKPSFDDVVYGDISWVLPERILTNIIEGLNKLNKVIPGVANDSTLLYAPEIKFHGLKVKTDEYLKTNKPNIYVAGDGAGLSRGIVGAACCGILAARGILK